MKPRSSTYIYLTSLLFLVLFATSTAFAQVDYSGIYYIDNNAGHDGATTGRYYLIPADDPKQQDKNDAFYSSNYSSQNGDPEKPFLTTYKTNKDAANVPTGVVNNLPNNSVWILKAVSDESGSYYIIHASSGKYVVYDPPYQAKPNRKAVHLLATDTPDENAKFIITSSGGGYNIRPQNVTTGNRFLNPAGTNQDYYHGNGGSDNPAFNYIGIIGLWSAADGNSIWFTESTLLSAPVISAVDENNTITITDANSLPSGYTIRYTTGDGTQDAPTATTGQEYSGPIFVEGNWTVKAVVVRYGIVLTETATKDVTPVIPTPVISFDNLTNKVSISCASVNASVYYNTGDGSQSDPTSSTGTLYENTFSVNNPTTVKAIAIYSGNLASQVAELTISQVATPTIQDNGSNAISITTATAGATIYYTTDGSTPTTSSTEYTGPLTDNISGITIKAIAVKDNMISSAITTGSVRLQCATPVITRLGLTFSISCNIPTGAAIYYSLDNSAPATLYDGPVAFTSDQLPMTVTAISRHADYTDSESATFLLNNGDGTQSSPYLIYSDAEFADFISNVNAGTASSAYYKLEIDVSAGSADAITTPFTGMFDGGLHTISNLHHALFNTINGGTVKNVILDNVTISGGSNAGAICNEAIGASRIYNCGVLASNSTVTTDNDGYTEITSCSSTINGSGNVGGIAGLLDGTSRVINCFSYANITGGNLVGGIVGNNNVATTSQNQATMVMNCMFYGDITGGTSKAPIYNGMIITNLNDQNGVSNFNYFRASASYVQNQEIGVYNCALAAETRYLQRFEFFRPLLNSNRALAAWWATNDADNKDEIMKWVLEPSQIGTSTPYPILKTPDYYPSVVNIDAAHAESFSSDAATAKTQCNQGRKFTTFTINIQNALSGAPSNANITTTSVTLNITDKDPAHFNFNYYKVQLPYYNEVGTYNYTGNKVVTGWKIVSISGGTNNFSTGSEASAAVNDDGDITLTTPYNFADRNCTDKDKFSVSGRVFNQGAYFDIPEGVTSITIEPYWAKCVYVSDQYFDVVYNQNMSTASNVTDVGGRERYPDNQITIDGSTQTVYTSMSNAVTGLNPSGTVYDNAIVLVGNVHGLDISNKTSTKPYTIMSIDLDRDNEPDFSYILRFDSRKRVHPVRIDFLNVIGLGMAQKSHGGTGTYNFGIMQPLGWFEVTNTGLFRVTQFEYDRMDRIDGPMILHGGVIEQWVTVGEGEETTTEAKKITYYHVGSNVWFKEFHIGAHQDKIQDNFFSPHPPISVTGGDYDIFYLTGYYNIPANNSEDNAECYINGGHFGKVAGTGMQGIGKPGGADNTGNIIWQIDNADIDEFYAGGINAAHIAEGNIWTVISNSRVDQFCGGPKFGDMNSDKKVVTNATNCTFRTFFGAGYGGNSYNREYPNNKIDKSNYNWNSWLAEVYTKEYKSAYKGVATRIDYQFIPRSNNSQNVARLFVDYVSFSLATTYDVTSKLTGCTITKSPLGTLNLFSNCIGNFYGGGNLGKVEGSVKSTLTNCIIEGNVFGAGYSATIPTVSVMENRFQTEPKYDTNLGAYLDAELPSTQSYSWEHADIVNSTATAINTSQKKLYTTVDLSKTNLGSVSGAITLTLTTNGNDGATIIGTENDSNTGYVFGGGDESAVNNTSTPSSASTTVNLSGNTTVWSDVYGGGKAGDVTGSVSVNIIEGTIANDVYGGGALANTNTGNLNDDESITTDRNTTTVNLYPGVYGGGRGQKEDQEQDIEAIEAMVYGNISVYQLGAILVPQYTADSLATAGRIFGCNNVNGSPMGHVYVYVSHTTKNSTSDKYAISAVYGGGNEASYIPYLKAQDNSESTEVVIDGCSDVTIHSVYGGGNAASTPATNVKVFGAKEIQFVYGGGNGAGMINGNPNPGANVGYKAYPESVAGPDQIDERAEYIYGSGKAITEVSGGTIHYVFGGSNTKGNVRNSTVAQLEELGHCQLVIGGIYGGGREAYMEGKANIELGCITGMEEIYGGSEKADVGGSVELTITSGTFKRVFGGNNKGGRIYGSITVNIEQTGCLPIIIEHLYLGGNNAPYSVYGYLDTSHKVDLDGEEITHFDLKEEGDKYPDPQLNIRSFATIDTVFGGGNGSYATMVGDPTVDINIIHGWVNGEFTGQSDYAGSPQMLQDDGVIGTVFGGGNEAKVIGNTKILIGDKLNSPVTLRSMQKLNDELDADQDHTISDHGITITQTENGVTYTNDTDSQKTLTVTSTQTVIGANITGNVYGGGNNADVTGSATIQLGSAQ